MAKIRQRRYRRITAREGGGIDDRLESRPRLPFAADSAVERAARIIRATDHRENVPALRIDRDERGLERGSMQPRESDRDGARINPAINAASGSVSALAGFRKRCSDIVSTP